MAQIWSAAIYRRFLFAPEPLWGGQGAARGRQSSRTPTVPRGKVGFAARIKQR